MVIQIHEIYIICQPVLLLILSYISEYIFYLDMMTVKSSKLEFTEVIPI